jgi:FkbM family methyltransferase
MMQESTIKQGRAVSAVARRLFPSKTMRSIAKRLLKNHTIRQSFHGGVICCNAVDHSWAWARRVSYETYDRELQDVMLELSRDRDVLIDVGCNVGGIALSVLLRNPEMEAVCVDPNPIAIDCLRQSQKLNDLSDRLTIYQAAVSGADERITFDFAESVMGHVSDAGEEVQTMPLLGLLDRFGAGRRCLLKIDVEGYETTLLKAFTSAADLGDTLLVVDLHPLDYNGLGDPAACVAHLRDLGLTVTHLDGTPAETVPDDYFHEIVAGVEVPEEVLGTVTSETVWQETHPA